MKKAALSAFLAMDEAKSAAELVGVGRFELPTPCSRSRCATRLRYTPSAQSSRASGTRVYSAAAPPLQGRRCTLGIKKSMVMTIEPHANLSYLIRRKPHVSWGVAKW